MRTKRLTTADVKGTRFIYNCEFLGTQETRNGEYGSRVIIRESYFFNRQAVETRGFQGEGDDQGN